MSVAERQIVHIDEEKCNGCGICISSCAEGAIQMIDGKAKLVSDSYCDGLGACLAPCPTGAISIISRPAEAFDAEAAERHVEKMKAASARPAGGCPGSAAKTLRPQAKPTSPEQTLACGCPGGMSRSLKEKHGGGDACACSGEAASAPAAASQLMNWPVQLKLVPPSAPYLKGADLLLAADCTPVAVPDFHSRFLKNRPVVIACPKLEDNEPQAAKLADILRTARPSSLTVLRMEVPCCGGLVRVAEEAIQRSGLDIRLDTVIISVDGTVLQ